MIRGFVMWSAAALAILSPSAACAQDSTPSTGVFKTAQEVFDICTSSKESDLESCDWFVMASHDMMKFYGDTDMGGSKICVPADTKELALRTAVVDYWRENPGSLKYSAVSTIYNALVAKYPC